MYSRYFDNTNLVDEIKNSSTHILPFQGVTGLSTSDRDALVQCFFFFDVKGSAFKEQETILQAIVDQAQFFYQYFYDKKIIRDNYD